MPAGRRGTAGGGRRSSGSRGGGGGRGVEQSSAVTGGGLAARGVEDVAGELAGGLGLDDVAHPHPRDLVHLRDPLGELLPRRVGQPRRERVQDRPLRRVAHGEDEREAKLGRVLVVYLSEARELLRRQAAQARALLLRGRLGREVAGERRLAREVRVRAEQRDLLLLRTEIAPAGGQTVHRAAVTRGSCRLAARGPAHRGRLVDDRLEARGERSERSERPATVGRFGDPRRLLVHATDRRKEGLKRRGAQCLGAHGFQAVRKEA
eukprot:736722-Prymnesium_polylepis.1